MTSPILDRHPLDHPEVTKILLSASATAAMKELGPCLVIATMADATAPKHAQGRMVLNCMKITKQAADDAYRVAKATHRAAKIKTPSSPLSDSRQTSP